MKRYEENYQLVKDAVAVKNKKPLACFSGSVVGAHINGMTVEECLTDPVKCGHENINFIQKLDEDSGGITCINEASVGMNMIVAITFSWYSKVLVPGVDIDKNTVWQVAEKKLIEADQYDEIIKMGFDNFVNEKIVPNIIDVDYKNKYLQIYAESFQMFYEKHKALGYPVLKDSRCPAIRIPFEWLSGLRSMPEFYYDCYTQLDKVKETCDAIFEDKYQQVEVGLEKIKDNHDIIGTWIGGWRTAGAMIAPKIWETLLWPYMKKGAEQLIRFNKVPVLHLDQNWDRDIERFGELEDGKYILNTDSMTNLREARKKLPNTCFMGDVPATLLTTGTPNQITDYVNRLIDDIGPAGLIVTAGCDTPMSAKRENIVAMLKAANEWS